MTSLRPLAACLREKFGLAHQPNQVVTGKCNDKEVVVSDIPQIKIIREGPWANVYWLIELPGLILHIFPFMWSG